LKEKRKANRFTNKQETMKYIKETFLLLAVITILYSCEQKKPPVFNQEVEENIQLESTMLGVSVIADSLFVPWELVWGPDDWIWVSEQSGVISRINPTTGEKRVILRLPIGERPEGAQGMIVHPDQERYPYVYINYKRFNSDSIRYNVVERYTYQNDTLIEPKLMMEDVAGNGHNGSRLAFHGPERILWVTGDQALRKTPQDLNNINGKVLRMDLEGNIPNDNPIPNSYVYALGFRNMQGLVVTAEGVIYTSEHGDATEDEINLILPKGNYGFPNIEGKVDNDLEKEFSIKHHTISPLISWTPTIAPAGLDYYSSDKIPEWNNSLLLTMLKGQGLRVLNLNENGDQIVKEEIFLEKVYGRIRDICVSPSGDVYISTSNHDWNPMTEPSERDDVIIRIAKVDTAVKTPHIAKTMKQSSAELATGETLYQQYCFSCHKAKGRGLKNIYPALASSEIVNKKELLIPIVLNGLMGNEYSMPAFNFLKDEELNKVLNYVRTSFGNKADSLKANEIASYRK